MGSDLRTSEAGLKLIMSYEGFRPVSKQLPDGRWVIGYGHTKAARENLRVSQAEAAAILRQYDLPPVEQALHDLLLVPVTQTEFDALVSFAFNIGVDQFENSDVLTLLNAGDRLKAASAMERWRKARVGTRDMIVDPLVRRRADEKAMFLKTSGAVPLAASSRFRPMNDDCGVQALKSSPKMNEPEADATGETDETESAPEAAARKVRERLTRILGEEEGHVLPVEDSEPSKPQAPHEASVEEIRAAISALVQDDTERPKPATGDIELEEITLDDGPLGALSSGDTDVFDLEAQGLELRDQSIADRKDTILIDDVTPAEVDPKLVEQATRKADRNEGPIETFLFGLVALLGTGLFAYGGAARFGWFGMDKAEFEGALSYLPPFLMLAGGLLFVVMAYYCGRAFMASRD
ncbi:lysozyme [Henriciella sp. AS95]|uniref:lysozyme n=1 Tax=Henriciella sp. AS95 TaxID=3135782 RepID=UPI0031702B1D